MSSRNEREAVLAILARIREEGTYSHIAVREMLDQCEREGMDRRQRAFVKRLTEGIIERRIEIDADGDLSDPVYGRSAGLGGLQ